MAKGIFIHRSDSRYNDTPASSYQFPTKYLSRVKDCVGDWIIYLEPTKVPSTKGYFAAAKVQKIVPDENDHGLYQALIETGSYIDFINFVPFNGPLGIVEQGVLNEVGKVSGRAQSAVRSISLADFNRIVDIGLGDDVEFLPRVGSEVENAFTELSADFVYDFERDRVANLGSRLVRDRLFRKRVVEAYDARCSITGLKLINGGGRAEVEAAHIRPVDKGGPDAVNNGIALSGTAHWMFDRGLISLTNDLEILVSRQINNPADIHNIINRNGYATSPIRAGDRPHPSFLTWHRENCFKV